MRHDNSVTIADVAKKAKVSVATASRVINNANVVSKPTVRKVRNAIEELEYMPNVTARNLRKRESRMILVLTPNFTNPFYTHIFSGIGEAAQERGYGIFISSCKEMDSVDFLSGMLKSKQVDGAILLASNRNYKKLEELSKQYPIVQCAEYIEGANVSSVSIDNYVAMREVVAYLLQNGHSRIGLITSNNNYISTQCREHGYYDELSAFNARKVWSKIAYASSDYTFESGMKAMSELLDGENQPTAVACISDILALGAIAEIQRRGLVVPNDISVVGFDDVDYTQMFHPFLTTIAQPCYDIGFTGVKLFCEQMKNGNEPRKVFLPYKLKIRETAFPLNLSGAR